MNLLSRLTAALRRRWALWWAGLRHHGARFGRGCDIRRRFELRCFPGAGVRFGEGCVLDNDLTVECRGTLRVGDRVIFGHHCTVAVRAEVSVGDDCMFAEMVSVRDHDHVFADRTRPYREQGFVAAPVHIGRNVWLGAKVTVCKGVRIGDNTVVGANAVVTRDLPANCVAVGVPARVVRSFEEPA